MAMYDLSYNPQDPLFDIPNFPGVRWGIQVFTLQNCYGLNPKKPNSRRPTCRVPVLHWLELGWAAAAIGWPGRCPVGMAG